MSRYTTPPCPGAVLPGTGSLKMNVDLKKSLTDTSDAAGLAMGIVNFFQSDVSDSFRPHGVEPLLTLSSSDPFDERLTQDRSAVAEFPSSATSTLISVFVDSDPRA